MNAIEPALELSYVCRGVSAARLYPVAVQRDTEFVGGGALAQVVKKYLTVGKPHEFHVVIVVHELHSVCGSIC